MAGNLFTVTTKFGISNGPTYQGQSQAAQPAGGNNDILIDQLTSLAIQPSGPQVLNNEGFLQSKFLGLGFLATVVSGGTAATSVTIELVGAGQLQSPSTTLLPQVRRLPSLAQPQQA